VEGHNLLIGLRWGEVRRIKPWHVVHGRKKSLSNGPVWALWLVQRAGDQTMKLKDQFIKLATKLGIPVYSI